MPKKRKRRVSSAENKKSGICLKKKILKSAFISLTVFFAVLVVFALIMTKSGLSEMMQTVIVMAASFTAAFTGAFLSSGKSHTKGLVSGVIMSLPLIVIISLVILILFGEIGVRTALMSLLMLSGGALGGIVRVNQRW